MDQIGRFPKFRLGRPLSPEERRSRAVLDSYRQSRSAEFLTTIKMNSSYLELTDRCFCWRGTMTTVGLIFLGLGIFLLVGAVEASVDHWPKNTGDKLLVIAGVSMPLTMLLGSAYIFLKTELFNLTHNPIRLDRRNRLVHVFLYNKELLSVPWDEVVFCIGDGNHIGGAEHDLRGHILADDQRTVKATFAFGHRSHDAGEIKAYWKFIRHYMEKGPEELLAKIRYCQPIAEGREPAGWALNSYFRQLGPAFYLFFPIVLIFWGGRMLANYTSRIPRWPPDIEAKCAISPDDPYAVDASRNGPFNPLTDLPGNLE